LLLLVLVLLGLLLELLHCWVLRALSFVSSKATQPDRFKTLLALLCFMSVFVFHFYSRGQNSDILWSEFRYGGQDSDMVVKIPILPQIDLLY